MESKPPTDQWWRGKPPTDEEKEEEEKEEKEKVEVNDWTTLQAR